MNIILYFLFNFLGAYVKPVRKSAAFWYNMNHNGEYQKNTLHAACPVLYGEKWVSNKWIRVNGEMFTRPCSLVK